MIEVPESSNTQTMTFIVYMLRNVNIYTILFFLKELQGQNVCTALNVTPPVLDSSNSSALTDPPSSQHASDTQIKVQSRTPYISRLPWIRPIKCMCESLFIWPCRPKLRTSARPLNKKTHKELHSCSTERNKTVNHFNAAVKYCCFFV